MQQILRHIRAKTGPLQKKWGNLKSRLLCKFILVLLVLKPSNYVSKTVVSSDDYISYTYVGHTRCQTWIWRCFRNMKPCTNLFAPFKCLILPINRNKYIRILHLWIMQMGAKWNSFIKVILIYLQICCILI